MELKDIVAISGIGGLHQIVGRNKNGLIVETIDEKKKRFSTTLSQKISVLTDIAIFTESEEVRLAQVIKNIKAAEDAGTVIPDNKASNDDLKAFMEKVLPEYDKERVYVSDIRKLANWYRILRDVIDYASLDEVEDNAGEGAADTAQGEETRSKSNRNFTPPAAKVAPVKGPAGKKTSTPRKMGS
jgi:hypothetical protein